MREHYLKWVETAKQCLIGLFTYLCGTIALIVGMILLIAIFATVKPYVVWFGDVAKNTATELINQKSDTSVSVGGFSPVSEVDVGINDRGEEKVNLTVVAPFKHIKPQTTYSGNFNNLTSPVYQNQSKSLKVSAGRLSLEFAVNQDGSIKYVSGLTVKIPFDKKGNFGSKVSVKIKKDEKRYNVKNFDSLPFAVPQFEKIKPTATERSNSKTYPAINPNWETELKLKRFEKGVR